MDVLQKIKVNNGSVWTSSELKDACRLVSEELGSCTQQYAELYSLNKDAIMEYQGQLQLVLKRWRKAKAEMSSFMEECRFVGSIAASSEAGDDGYDAGLGRADEEGPEGGQLYGAAIRAVLNDSLETECYTFGESNYMVRKPLLTFLEVLGSTTNHKDGMHAARLYAIMCSRLYGDRLDTLPQQAAVFLSECHLLSLATDDNGGVIRRFGMHFLQGHIDALSLEIREIVKDSGAVFLDSSNIDHLFRRPFDQIVLQTDRFRAVLGECFCNSAGADKWLCQVHERIFEKLAGALLEALWNVLCEAFSGGIAKDCCSSLRGIIQEVLEFSEKTCSGGHPSGDKLKAVGRLAEQPLLGWMGAFRKGTYRSVLTPTDYATLIRTFFADSSLRKSCLREIEEAGSDDRDSASSGSDHSE